MRYSAEHKAETRERLLASSGAIAKQQGFAVTGVERKLCCGRVSSGVP